MDDRDRPNLPLVDLATITDEHYLADRSAWEALRPLLKPRSWSETTRFNGPRPPKEPAKFYLILSNYSTEVFFQEARMYPRYPPNPNFGNWIIRLAQRVEDHVIGVVKDIESSDSEKDFSYHDVAEDEMRKTIRQRLGKEMKDHFLVEFPRSSHLLRRSQKLAPEELRKIGIDPNNASPLLQEVIEQFGGPAPAESPKDKPTFGEELDRLLQKESIRPEALADKMGIEWSTVYRHISGRHSPNRDTYKRYIETLSGILGHPVNLPMPSKRQSAGKNASKMPSKRQ